ncbi:MAG: hypothetical protein ACRC6V_05825 [Bacteroidales bacterium]
MITAADTLALGGALNTFGKDIFPALAKPVADSMAEKERINEPDGTTHPSPPTRAPIVVENKDVDVPKLKEEAKGVPLPDPKTDPGGAIAAGALNRGAGFGNGTGMVKMPEPPTKTEEMARAVEEEGKQVMFDMNKVPKPMESNAFNMGLMSFGLNLLSHGDYAQAFNAAGEHFQQSYGREKREIWAQDLVSQGYDAQDIQRWIQTGDNKDLTDPMEKKMKMQQYRLGQENLSKAMYENSDSMRQYALEGDQYDRQMKQAELNQSWNFQNENLKISQTQANIANENLKMEQEMRPYKLAKAKAEAKAAEGKAGGKPDPKMFVAGMVSGGLDWKDVVDAAKYTPGMGDYVKGAAIEKFGAKTDQDALRQDYTPEKQQKTMVQNRVSELMGRMLSGAALSETQERPTWVNALMPTKAEIDRGDVNALRRKENTFNALKIYANSFSETGKGSLTLNDVQMLGSGTAQIMVDEETGVPSYIVYPGGNSKPL